MNCPYCGTAMTKTTWGRYLCPNCGIVEKHECEPEESENKDPKYIG